MEGGYEVEPDADDCRQVLEVAANRLERLVTGDPVGRPWGANYVMTEIGRLAEEIRAALTRGTEMDRDQRDHGEDISNALKAIAEAMPGLRDRFAAAALTGFLAAFAGEMPMPAARSAAKRCYEYASAMLAERLRRKGAEGA